MAKITLAMLEEVMERTGEGTEEAMDALRASGGDLEGAVSALSGAGRGVEKRSEVLASQLRDLLKTGTVDRIVLKHKGEVILNLPVGAGIAGGVIGLAASPWAMVAGLAAIFGFRCTIEVIRKGRESETLPEERGYEKTAPGKPQPEKAVSGKTAAEKPSGLVSIFGEMPDCGNPQGRQRKKDLKQDEDDEMGGIKECPFQTRSGRSGKNPERPGTSWADVTFRSDGKT